MKMREFTTVALKVLIGARKTDRALDMKVETENHLYYLLQDEENTAYRTQKGLEAEIEKCKNIIRDNSIEAMFPNYDEHTKKLLNKFGKEIMAIDDPKNVISEKKEDLFNPADEVIFFLEELASSNIAENVELNDAIIYDICNVGVYITKAYIAQDDEKDVCYRSKDLKDIMDELLSLCPSLRG